MQQSPRNHRLISAETEPPSMPVNQCSRQQRLRIDGYFGYVAHARTMARLSRSRGRRDGFAGRFHNEQHDHQRQIDSALTANAATAPLFATTIRRIAGP